MTLKMKKDSKDLREKEAEMSPFCMHFRCRERDAQRKAEKARKVGVVGGEAPNTAQMGRQKWYGVNDTI